MNWYHNEKQNMPEVRPIIKDELTVRYHQLKNRYNILSINKRTHLLQLLTYKIEKLRRVVTQ